MPTKSLNSNEVNLEESTLLLDFKARTDLQLLELKAASGGWTLQIKNTTLLLEGENLQAKIFLDMEDTANVRDESWHSLAIVAGGEGSRIYLDGYQCYSATANLSPAAFDGASHYELFDGPGLETARFEFLPQQLSKEAVLAEALEPTPMVEFAAAYLSDYDLKQLHKLHTGTIFARYRVRGPGQVGVIMAARSGDKESLRIRLSNEGLYFELLTSDGEWLEYFAPGSWNQGYWHDVVVRAARGAIDIYVDGYLEAHAPGQVFFDTLTSLDYLTIGQNTIGERLSGEVRNAAIYGTPLNDWQIKQVSNVAPFDTQCLADSGYENSVSYRIPSLLTTKSGTVIAGADQRETIANDAPNSINFVVRRSFDSGQTWGPLQTVIQYPGTGASGASVIDSCIVQDENTGRIVVVIDHFPGAVGQPNNATGIGVDPDGRFALYDREGTQYRWNPDGTVQTLDGQPTEFVVDEKGNVTRNGQAAGNIFLAYGEDPNESLFTMRTCFLQVVHSDDEGETWSAPVNINHQVKEEWMPFLGTAPGNGIQLKCGQYRGRLVIPAYYNTEDYYLGMSACVIFSDDGGQTWTRSASPNDGREFEGQILNSRHITDQHASTHECTVIERADGSLLLLMRNQHPSGKVLASVSQDGGATWGQPTPVEAIDEIFCQPNAISFPTAEHPERVIFANASQLMPYRGRGVLRLSEDGGRTWVAARTINPAHYVYQCMTKLPDGDLGILWEREMQGLYFSKLPITWLEDAK